MKAINFLEWFDKQGEKVAFVVDENSLMIWNSWLEEVVDFYSQPFRPEMITELFEGWKQPTALREYKNDKFEILCDGERTAYYAPNITVNKQPSALNDFISDCTRAGIELTWKPEIIKNLFGE